MLARLIIRWIVLTIALYITVIVGQQIGLHMSVTDPVKLLLGAGMLGFVNAVISPILRFLACAINCLTMGLAGVLINVLLFWWVGQLKLGYEVNDFWAALFGSIILAFVAMILNIIIPEPKRYNRYEDE
ncbi:MAG: phage holin family protein [bacterium]